jgi:hypothetical protein
LARAASKAERLASFRAAEEKLIQMERNLATAQEKKAPAGIKKSEETVAAARKTVESARKSLDQTSDQYTPLSPVHPNLSSGRRSALAGWITSRDNPLTARVAVNHIWMRHFGKPLVESVNDFGRNGKKPTQPDLLDWLACELIDNHWTMKHVHRLIVTSAAYCMQSKAVGPIAMLDAENRYLWHFNARRAEGEIVRDCILHAAGELDPAIGGPVLENYKEAVSHRRSIYFAVYPEDGGHLQFVAMFDAPDPCDCYKRGQSILPQQALVMTNSRLLLDCSRLLAGKLSKQVGDDAAFVVVAFEQVLSRRPTVEEQSACLDFLRKQTDLLRTMKASNAKGDATIAPSTDPAIRAREGLVRALFSHDDFVTMR